MIPNAMKACTTGWKRVPTKKRKFDVFTEDEYRHQYMRHSLADSYVHAADVIERNLNESGQEINAANTVEYLVSERVFSDIAT